MSNYLLTWNPKITKWDTLDSEISKVEKKHSTNVRWSCGMNKSIKPDDLIILMRLGREPKGIVGLGYSNTEVETRPHWKEEERLKGKSARSVKINFFQLQSKPIIPLASLQKEFPNFNWTPQSSGIGVSDQIAFKLFEEVIEKNTGKVSLLEGTARQSTILRYDRNPLARQLCIDYYGYDCHVCGFNFAAKYGRELGNQYIEVHHLHPLSQTMGEYSVDPVRDLRPVCSNCHRMLHRKKEVISIDELKSYVGAAWSKD